MRWDRWQNYFGDNRNGLIPTAGSMVKIVYRVGGGLKGNIVKNTLIKVNGTGYDANGQPVAVTMSQMKKLLRVAKMKKLLLMLGSGHRLLIPSKID